MSFLRSSFLKFGAILFGILLAWMLVEVGLRLFFNQIPYTLQVPLRHVRVSPFQHERILPTQAWNDDRGFQKVIAPGLVDEMKYPDPRIGFRVTTSNWLMESHVGFRVDSADYTPTWPVDAVVVGDSFSFCYTDYADCWVPLLTEQADLSIVNLGMVATGSVSHLEVLKAFGLPHEPRFVIWQWYGNDFNDDYGLAVLREEIAATESDPRQLTTMLPDWLTTYSGIGAIAQAVLNDRTTDFETFSDPYVVEVGDELLWFGRNYTLTAHDVSLDKNQIGRTHTEEAILEAQTILADADVELIIVLIPTKEEVYHAQTEQHLGSTTLDALTQGRTEMLAFCATHQLHCFDTTPTFTASAEQNDLLYWSEDTHLNPAGNRHLTTSIHQFLKDMNLIE